MTRQEAIDRLCDVYAGSFDVTRHEESRAPLMATMDFYVHNSKYVLSKKAKLWEANSFEYVYLFSVPHLTKEIYEQCEKLAYEEGMARIQPGPSHMYTYISAIFLCDSCDEDARRALMRNLLFAYAQLSVHPEKKYDDWRRRVRAELEEQEGYFHLLSKRNRLLAKMVCRTPGLFALTYRLYEKLFRREEEH